MKKTNKEAKDLLKILAGARVMYAVSNGSYTYGNFTLLVDAEGNPLLWDGRSEE